MRRILPSRSMTYVSPQSRRAVTYNMYLYYETHHQYTLLVSIFEESHARDFFMILTKTTLAYSGN